MVRTPRRFWYLQRKCHEKDFLKFNQHKIQSGKTEK
jgi:hypothetical protein